MGSDKKYNTHLASEFYVLSMLHRMGADAALTLGNKKAVDISVIKREGEAITIDVKGVAGRDDWPADNIKSPKHDRHFIVLVSFEKRINDPAQVPSVWEIPAKSIEKFVKRYKTRVVVSRAEIGTSATEFRNAWHLIGDQD